MLMHNWGHAAFEWQVDQKFWAIGHKINLSKEKAKKHIYMATVNSGHCVRLCDFAFSLKYWFRAGLWDQKHPQVSRGHEPKKGCDTHTLTMKTHSIWWTVMQEGSELITCLRCCRTEQWSKATEGSQAQHFHANEVKVQTKCCVVQSHVYRMDI